MARITVEDCLGRVDNRFSLVHLAAKRVRQIKKGDDPYVQCKNREVVTSLREIAAGAITLEKLQEIEQSRKMHIEYRPPVTMDDAVEMLRETGAVSGLDDDMDVDVPEDEMEGEAEEIEDEEAAEEDDSSDEDPYS